MSNSVFVLINLFLLHASQACEIPRGWLLRLLMSALALALAADQRQLGTMFATLVVITNSNRVAGFQQMFLQLDQVVSRFEIRAQQSLSGWPQVLHLCSVVNL
jgi:hypothetical protein